MVANVAQPELAVTRRKGGTTEMLDGLTRHLTAQPAS